MTMSAWAFLVVSLFRHQPYAGRLSLSLSKFLALSVPFDMSLFCHCVTPSPVSGKAFHKVACSFRHQPYAGRCRLFYLNSQRFLFNSPLPSVLRWTGVVMPFLSSAFPSRVNRESLEKNFSKTFCNCLTGFWVRIYTYFVKNGRNCLF